MPSVWTNFPLDLCRSKSERLSFYRNNYPQLRRVNTLVSHESLLASIPHRFLFSTNDFSKYKTKRIFSTYKPPFFSIEIRNRWVLSDVLSLIVSEQSRFLTTIPGQLDYWSTFGFLVSKYMKAFLFVNFLQGASSIGEQCSLIFTYDKCARTCYEEYISVCWTAFPFLVL